MCVMEERKENSRRLCGYIPKRYIFTLLGFLTFGAFYAQRMVMNVAIVAMVNNSAIESYAEASDQQTDHQSCPDTKFDQNITYHYQNGKYVWQPSLQGAVLGSYFYGFICTQLTGGWLTERIGARNVFVSTLLISSILTLLIPIGAEMAGVIMVIILRVMTGLSQGVAYPAMFTLFSRWAPQQERSTLVAICWTGNNIGTILSTIVTGYLCEYGFSGGWPSCFYVFGMTGCVMFVVLFFCLHDSPAKHTSISKQELLYIQQNQYCPTSGQKKRVIPWRKIATSVPVWGMAIAKLTSAWAFFTLLTKLPAYLESVLHFPIYENGWMNALFHFCLAVSTALSGFLADCCMKKSFCKLTLLRKFFGSLGRIGPAVCLIAIPLVGCDKWTVVVLLTLSVTLFGFIAGGDMPMMMDMANDFAGILFGFINGLACLGGVFAPLAAGFILDKNEGSITQWSIVFYVSSGVSAVGVLALIFLGTAEPQKWAIQPSKNDGNNVGETSLQKASENSSSQSPTLAQP